MRLLLCCITLRFYYVFTTFLWTIVLLFNILAYYVFTTSNIFDENSSFAPIFTILNILDNLLVLKKECISL